MCERLPVTLTRPPPAWLAAVASALAVAGCASLWGFDDLAVGNAGADGSDAEDSAPPADASATDGDAAEVPVDSGTDGRDSTSQLADSGGHDSASQLADSGPVPEACTPLVHSNGLGGTYLDCAPLGTYDVTTATEACASWTGNATSCFVAGGECVSGEQSAGHWGAWAYASGKIGQAEEATVEFCPQTPGDPMWN